MTNFVKLVIYVLSMWLSGNPLRIWYTLSNCLLKTDCLALDTVFHGVVFCWLGSSCLAGPQLRAVLEDKAAEVDASSSNFWIMVAALKVRSNLHPTYDYFLSAIVSRRKWVYIVVAFMNNIMSWQFVEWFVQEFIANEGQGEPPLDGSIPDMHSFTE